MLDFIKSIYEGIKNFVVENIIDPIKRMWEEANAKLAAKKAAKKATAKPANNAAAQAHQQAMDIHNHAVQMNNQMNQAALQNHMMHMNTF